LSLGGLAGLGALTLGGFGGAISTGLRDIVIFVLAFAWSVGAWIG
jgi:hypothetical protein